MRASSALNRIARPAIAKAELRGEIPANKQPQWLTAAIVGSVHAVRGTVKAIAAALGERDSAVYEVADANAQRALKAWWIPAIVRETGSFDILDAIEREVGRVAFRLPDPIQTDHDELHAGLARTLNDVGAFVKQHGDALADNRLTADECARLDVEIARAIAGLCEYRELARRRAERDAVKVCA